MLNFDVKRKINTLRDILVGKVPDPKAQVEQITIALIYKFMDDMDIAGSEFGGKRVFFTGDYEKYAFSQIMLSEHSAQKRLDLYAEGIDKVSNNPDLPQLFRDILRGAYIPYRDPETLNMFLKEINEFSYSDSEDLGNAFEYLLSIMGSQGDAGQFRTPRHIIDMMVEIIAPKKNESVLDPACGTAGFLISAFKYIEAHNCNKDGNSTLTADDMNRMVANFAGYDISPDMVRLSRVNMYLHGFSKPPISEYDTLTSLEKWDDTYDVIFANPPFMTPKGGIIPHNRYRISAKRSEVLFVDYIAEHLNPTGRAAVIVPEGIVFQSATAYKNLRRYLVDDGLLYAVISLPAGVFNPYSGVKTSILLMDRTLAKERDSILFVKLNNDGFDLGAQRREIKGSEIPDVVSVVQDYQKGVDVKSRENVALAKKTGIAGQDYILVGERYKAPVVVDTAWPMVELSEVCEEIKSGFACGNSDKNIDGILHIRPMNITPDGQFTMVGSKYIDSSEMQDDYLIKKGDVLFNNTNSKELVGKTCYIREDISAGFSNHISRIRVSQKLIPEYLAYILQHMFECGHFLRLCNKWVGQAGINAKTLAQQVIPLPPLSVQEEIVAEIDGYQKIIDGAKQIVDNYKPTIKIDPAWKKVKLGEIFDLASGKGLPSKERVAGKYLVYGGNGVTGTHNEYLVEQPTLIIGRVGEYCGAVHITLPYSWVTDNALMVTKYKIDVNQQYLLVLLNQININQYAKVGGQPSISQSTVYNLSIPFPPAETQSEIIIHINEEMSIVEQNKRLIEIFRQKIKDKIADVWGE